MKELEKWQIISFLSRMSAMVLGLVQTFVIIRILSVSEWGLVQLAVSIGGALGIYQHLGLASASTREISSAKKEDEIFKIFCTSAFIRYCISLPLAIGLFILSKHIALNIYNNEALIFPLKIYAVTLLFQSVQSILNSVISGTKRFKVLFIYQVAIAAFSVLLYIPLVYFYKVSGYFYSFLAFNVVASIVLSILAFKPLKEHLKLPTKKEFKELFKEIFSISMAIYIVKIIYTNWEKFGNNVLGAFSTAETVAIFSFAMLYAKKLMHISDSVTAVNLPVLSEEYVKDNRNYRSKFSKNFDRVFSVIVVTSAFAAYWAPTVTKILVGSNKYNQALVYIPPMVLAFFMYSLINIVNSSVLIPAKLKRQMIISYALLIIGTAGFFFSTNKVFDLLTAMSWATAFGGVLCFTYMSFMVKKKMDFVFFNIDHLAVVVQAFFVGWLCNIHVFWVKAVAFPFFAFLLVWSLFISGFVKKKDFVSILDKLKGFKLKKA